MSRPATYTYATIRRNSQTADESKRYATRIGKPNGCVYGSGGLIVDTPEGGLVFVIEMNIANEAQKRDKLNIDKFNCVLGIGMIVNTVITPEQYCDIHENKLYNGFTYIGDERVDRAELNLRDPKICQYLDIVLFKGKTHQKRNPGLNVLHDDFLKDKKVMELLKQHDELRQFDVKKSILDLFKQRRLVQLKRKSSSEEPEQVQKAVRVPETCFISDEMMNFSDELDETQPFDAPNVMTEVESRFDANIRLDCLLDFKKCLDSWNPNGPGCRDFIPGTIMDTRSIKGQRDMSVFFGPQWMAFLGLHKETLLQFIMTVLLCVGKRRMLLKKTPEQKRESQKIASKKCNAVKVVCICGIQYDKSNKWGHNRSTQHIEWKENEDAMQTIL